LLNSDNDVTKKTLKLYCFLIGQTSSFKAYKMYVRVYHRHIHLSIFETVKKKQKSAIFV